MGYVLIPMSMMRGKVLHRVLELGPLQRSSHRMHAFAFTHTKQTLESLLVNSGGCARQALRAALRECQNRLPPADNLRRFKSAKGKVHAYWPIAHHYKPHIHSRTSSRLNSDVASSKWQPRTTRG